MVYQTVVMLSEKGGHLGLLYQAETEYQRDEITEKFTLSRNFIYDQDSRPIVDLAA